MSRLFIAFILAIFFHALLGLLPWSKERQTMPQPTGNESITLKLTPVNTVIKNSSSGQTEKTEHQQTPFLQQERVKEGDATPAKRPLPVANSPKIPIAAPVQQIKKKKVPKMVQLLAGKRPQQIQQASAPPSGNPFGSTLPATPAKTSSNSAEAPSASPAIIKAKPLYDQNPKPPYPNLARQRGWQGVVILAVTILEDGSPNQLKIQTSSGHDLLDKTALKTVKQWRFLPGTKNNIPTTMEVLVPVHFILQ